MISRHGFYSDDLYFGDGALGNPSRFQPSSLPIYDWVQIADDVYQYGQIDDRAHPDAAQFVKYTGQSASYEGSNGKALDFTLILYRDTKIVHSLFPRKDMVPGMAKSKLKKIKRALNLAKAETTLWYDWLTIEIPYVDKDITERYVIIVRIDLENMHGKAHLQINWPNGQPRYSINVLMEFDVALNKADVETNNIEFTRFFNSFVKFGNFEHIEEIMMRTETNLFPDNDG